MKWSAIGLVALVCAVTPVCAATEDCHVLIAAMMSHRQPYLQTISTSGPPRAAKTDAASRAPHAFQVVWSGTRHFLGVDGRWMDDFYRPERLPAKIPAAFSCRVHGETMLSGEAVVYHTIRRAGVGTVARVWLAKASGLIVRSVDRTRDGRLMVVTYDYDHVPVIP